jgi:hypothetical protein
MGIAGILRPELQLTGEPAAAAQEQARARWQPRV